MKNLIIALILSLGLATTAQAVITNSQVAYDACVDATKAQLKSPSTAQFEPLKTASSGLMKDGHINVNMYFDAANSYGAMLRGRVHCFGTKDNPTVYFQ